MLASQSLTRRLLPLYIAAFFQSAVLFYAIEKLFMRSIGFDNTGIGIMVAVYSGVMLVVETPSGIIADRWSRKGVLILASCCLVLSSLIGGLSYSIGMYLVTAIFWGIFFACYSGMYDSIIYDVIAETGRESKLFDKLYGRVQLMESSALVLGALAGGFLASAISLRFVYFASIPLNLLPIVALIFFREPTLHKQQARVSVAKQITQTLSAILRRPSLVPIILVLILRSALAFSIFEFAQLWLLGLHTPTEYYGIANAVLLASIGLGGVLVDHLGLTKFMRMVLTTAVMLGGFIGMIAFRDTALTVLAQFVAASGLIAVYVIFSRLLHDQLAPSIRAGAASATSTLGRLFIIPLAIVFTYMSQRLDIFEASYIPLGLAAAMAVLVLVVAGRNQGTGLEASRTPESVTV